MDLRYRCANKLRAVSNIIFARQEFRLAASFFGLTSAALSRLVGVTCVGLLGADVLRHFDHILDPISGTVTTSASELEHSGKVVRLSEFMGIPIVTARIADRDYRMFFDTGAQFSYFQEDSLSNFPYAGSVTDFYPGVGQFPTETYLIEVALGSVTFTVRCGSLPALLGATLMMADTQGIIGNEVLQNRVTGFFRGEKYYAYGAPFHIHRGPMFMTWLMSARLANSTAVLVKLQLRQL